MWLTYRKLSKKLWFLHIFMEFQQKKHLFDTTGYILQKILNNEEATLLLPKT